MLVNEGLKPAIDLITVPNSPEVHEIDVRSYLGDLPESQFLVYSPSALRRLGIDGQDYASRGVSDLDTSIALTALLEVEIPQTCQEIAVFGAGRAIDMAKYLGHIHMREVNVVPSLLSTNALGTPFGCYEDSAQDHTKTTITTGYARRILVDYDHLEAQGRGAGLYGLADALSITTALRDWDLAIEQDPSVEDADVYAIAKTIEKSCLDQIDSDQLDIRSVFNLIVNSAYITGLHGSGRPESGSEHIFSKVLELATMREGGRVMHGQSVGLGILLMATLQHNPRTQELFSAVRSLEFLAEFAGDQDALKQRAAKILTQIMPHNVRYSVVDAELENLRDPEFSSDLASEVVNRLFCSGVEKS
ncbi:MAG: iron-containing alcohol dehydrogenase [Patescibacteria group bacterium]